VPFYRYDVAEHAWTRLADAPVGAYSRCAMAMQGDRLFVLFNIQRDMLLYDILTDSWLRYSSNPTGDQTGTVNMAGDGQSIYLAPGWFAGTQSSS